MKSKKLISLICAAAMTASVMAGLAVNASAAETTVWSNTFDGFTKGIFLDGTGVGSNTDSAYIEGLTFVTGSRDGGDRGIYENTDGETVYTGSYYSIEEKSATDKYLHLSYPMFSSAGRYAHVDFTETAATADKDAIIDFDLKLTDGLAKGETTDACNAVLRLGDDTTKDANIIEVDKAANSIGSDWVHVRVIVNNSTGAKLYIDKAEVTSAAKPAVKTLASFLLYSGGDGESNFTPPLDAGGDFLNAETPTLSPAADIDNLVIYTADAGTVTATTDSPLAETTESDVTPPPVATPRVLPAAPVLTAPSSATESTIQSYNFEDVNVNKWPLGTEDTDDDTTIPGLNIHLGSRASGGNAETYAAVVKTKADKAFQMAANRFSTAGRSPRVEFTKSLPIDDGVSTVLAFEVYLTAQQNYEENAQPRLYFLKDTTQAGEDGTGAFRNVAAIITAVEDEVFYRGDNEESDRISAYVTPDEWHKVTFVITPTSEGATHRVYIDDDYDEASISCKYVSYGEKATTMDDLPMLATESKAAKVNGEDTSPNYGLVTIDNILAYQGEVDNPKQLIPATEDAPEPEVVVNAIVTTQLNTVNIAADDDYTFDAVLIHAKYDANGVLTSAKMYNVDGITQAGKDTEVSDLTEGDKLFVWSGVTRKGGLKPYAEVVTVGALR